MNTRKALACVESYLKAIGLKGRINSSYFMNLPSRQTAMVDYSGSDATLTHARLVAVYGEPKVRYSAAKGTFYTWRPAKGGKLVLHVLSDKVTITLRQKL